MKLKYVFVLEAIFSLLTGIGLAVTPKIVLSLYRLDTDAVGIFMSENMGGLYCGLGLLAWLVRNAGQTELRKPIGLAYAAYHLILLVVAIKATWGSAFMFEYGWVSVVIEAFFAASFGYFSLVKTNT